MKSRFSLGILNVGIILALSLLGCGGNTGDRPTLAPVKGTVTYDGQPLAQGVIVFHPATGRSGSGKIKDGQIIEVTTFDPNDGAIPGPCSVTVQSIEVDPKDAMAPPKWLIPQRYGVKSTSGFTADIQLGKTNDLKFELTSK